MDEHERELEQAMREGLAARAERVDVAVPVADRARRAARGRRTTRWAVVGLAGASVVAVATAGVVVSRDDQTGIPAVATQSPITTPSGTTTVPAPVVDTRVEYWRGLQVQVPSDWTWGSTPGVCGAPPVGEPYVGRPIGYTDACGTTDPDSGPTAPYVWLDADVPVGSVDLGGGWMRETIAVDGVRLTVATQDDSLRHQIIGSAAAQDLCAAEVDQVPRARFDSTTEGVGGFIDGRLCTYRRNADGNGFRLIYAKRLDETTVADTFAAVANAPTDPGDVISGACAIGELVVINGAYADDFGSPDARLEHDVVYVLPGCGVKSTDPKTGMSNEPKQVTESTVEPWATSEFMHLLVGPYDQWAYRYFIGVQG